MLNGNAMKNDSIKEKCVRDANTEIAFQYMQPIYKKQIRK